MNGWELLTEEFLYPAQSDLIGADPDEQLGHFTRGNHVYIVNVLTTGGYTKLHWWVRPERAT